MFELPPCSVDLTPWILTVAVLSVTLVGCQIKKTDIFRIYYQIWCPLNSDELEVIHLDNAKKNPSWHYNLWWCY